MNAETKSPHQILLQGLESVTNEAEFRKASNKVFEDAFTIIFAAHEEGKLQWVRSGQELRDFQTQVVVKNGQGREVAIPIYFFTTFDGDGIQSAFLTLGERDGNAPCRNDYDARVKKLFTFLSGEPWSPDPIGDKIRAGTVSS